MSKSKLQIGNLSDVGRKRTANEDYYGSFTGNYGNLIVVCDGMGGHKGGATASRIAVESIKQHFEQLSDNFDPKAELKTALEKANNNIIQKASESEELKEMGSTAVVLLIREDNAYYAHVGDSRIYLIRENKIYQLTKDHSLVQQLVDSGIIDEEAAKSHPQKNVISRSLGADGKNQPDIAEPLTIFKGDIFILCTDGLSGYLSNEELLEIASKNEPQTACAKMVELANDRGGKDNITVQIVKVIKGKRLPFKISDKFNKLKIPLILSSILIVVFTLFMILDVGNKIKFIFPINKADSTKKFENKDKSTIKNLDTLNNKIQNDTLSIKTFNKDSVINNKPKDSIEIIKKTNKNNLKNKKELK
ncbi:MAG: Stp1/IreP family PP2C-type Ser/Thr phosphatase [Ignavibacterium sp.]|nr:Stp1/IreP family PP2C-type Ser/Thr phosphatase [Ignavibacterium sp.]